MNISTADRRTGIVLKGVGGIARKRESRKTQINLRSRPEWFPRNNRRQVNNKKPRQGTVTLIVLVAQIDVLVQVVKEGGSGQDGE
jgi:hypothetical protein